jgi:hypothetical protein
MLSTYFCSITSVMVQNRCTTPHICILSDKVKQSTNLFPSAFQSHQSNYTVFQSLPMHAYICLFHLLILPSTTRH